MALHNPTDADNILTAVLLANHLGDSATAIQEWLDGFKGGVPHLSLPRAHSWKQHSNCVRGRRWTA